VAAAPAKKKPVCIFLFGVPSLSKKHLFVIFWGFVSVLITFCILVLISRRRF
jgi:hypothetical protein